MTRTCNICGKDYEAKRSTSKYCSDKCRHDSFRMTTNRVRIPNELRFAILQRDGFRCRFCGYGPAQGKELRVDHAKSLDDGGAPLDMRNLVTTCHPCNSGKGNKSVEPPV